MATLAGLLAELQSADNAVRKAAEERLESALGANPDDVLTGLVRVARDGDDKTVSVYFFADSLLWISYSCLCGRK
jgi:hypothetical protein